MSTKNICLALLAIALTAGLGTVAEAHRASVVETAATVPPTCTMDYSTETGADGRATSVVSLTCSRSAHRLANGAAL